MCILATLFPLKRLHMYQLIFPTSELGNILGDFVKNSSGHPAHNSNIGYRNATNILLCIKM
jgi:hypothetical protein